MAEPGPRISQSPFAEEVDPIIVKQENGLVKFYFYTKDHEFGGLIPALSKSLSVRREDQPRPVWEIEGVVLGEGVHEITYGEVPRGFRQKRPNQGSTAPALQAGARYVVIGTVRSLGAATFMYQPAAPSN